MRRLGQWMTGSLVLWAIVLAVAWTTSEGEPVCEGPLILSVDDSDPPQCPGRLDGVLDVGPVLLGASIALGLVGFAVTVLLGRRGEPGADDPSQGGQKPEV